MLRKRKTHWEAYGFEREEEAILSGIAVKREYWKKGVGKRLLSFFRKTN